jgi:hypothetical protein
MVARRHRASTVQGCTTLRLTMLGTSAERNGAEQNGAERRQSKEPARGRSNFVHGALLTRECDTRDPDSTGRNEGSAWFWPAVLLASTEGVALLLKAKRPTITFCWGLLYWVAVG